MSGRATPPLSAVTLPDVLGTDPAASGRLRFMRGVLLVCAAVLVVVAAGVAVVAGLDPTTAGVAGLTGSYAVTGERAYHMLGGIKVLDCLNQNDCLAEEGSMILLIGNSGGSWLDARLPSSAGALSVNLTLLTCAATRTCWSAGATSNGGGYLLRSVDAGRSWYRVQLPAGTGSIAALSCPLATWCMVVAAHRERSVALVTNDAGLRWQEHELGPTPNNGASLSCPTVGSCWFAADTSGARDLLMRSGDGGLSWQHLRPPPLHDSKAVPGPIQSIECTSASNCAVREGMAGSSWSEVFTTADTARSWHAVTLPAPVEHGALAFGNGVDATCDGTSDCVAAGQGIFATTTDAGRSWVEHTVTDGNWLLPPPATALSCWGADDCAVAVGIFSESLALTTNGGRSWTSGRLPDDVVAQAVQCAADGVCVVGNVDLDDPAVETVVPRSGTVSTPALPGGWGAVFAIDPPMNIPGNAPVCGPADVCTMLAVTKGRPHHTFALLVSSRPTRGWAMVRLPAIDVGLESVQAVCTSVRHCLALWISKPRTGEFTAETIETSDAGRSWQRWTTTVPTGEIDVYGTANILELVCASAMRCLIFETTLLGHPNGLTPWLDVTSDGGHRWAEVSIPGPPTGVFFSRCTRRGECMLVGYLSASESANEQVLLSSDDGGQNWSVRLLPVGLKLDEAPDCSLPTRCWAGGTYRGRAAVASSTDGGSSWLVGMLGSDAQPRGPSSLWVSCASPDTCVAVTSGTTGGSIASAVILFSNSISRRKGP